MQTSTRPLARLATLETLEQVEDLLQRMSVETKDEDVNTDISEALKGQTQHTRLCRMMTR